MTQIQEFICDVCGESQTLPIGWETNYLTLFGGMIGDPRHACENCKKSILDFMKEKKKIVMASSRKEDGKVHSKTSKNKKV